MYLYGFTLLAEIITSGGGWLSLPEALQYLIRPNAVTTNVRTFHQGNGYWLVVERRSWSREQVKEKVGVILFHSVLLNSLPMKTFFYCLSALLLEK